MTSSRFSPALLLAAIAAISLLHTLPVQAGASNKDGNPFGNGTHFQTTGTFSSVVRGQNLTGTMTFSTGLSTNTNSSGAPGICDIVYAGYLYEGNASGEWDPSSETISGVFQAGNVLSGTNTAIIYPELYNTNVFPVLIPVVTNQVTTVNEYLIVTNTQFSIIGTNPDGSSIINTNKTITTITTNSYQTNLLFTNYVAVEPQGSNNFQDTIYMVGNFSGDMQNDYPNQTFSATGSITQQQLYPQQLTGAEGTVPVQLAAPLTIPVTVQGVRISDTYANYQYVTNALPYSQTTYSITNISGL